MSSNRSLLEKRFQMLFFAVVLIAGLGFFPVSSMTQVRVVQAQVATGDYNTGRMLFTGAKRFANGGPPCMSCHSAGVGALGGGSLGPSLKDIFAGPKNALLNIAWVNSPGIPVMGPVFSNRNIKAEEMDHLRAFFKMASEQPAASSKSGPVIGIGAAGFIGILIFFGLVWSGRYRSRNKGTAHDAIWRNYGGKGGQR